MRLGVLAIGVVALALGIVLLLVPVLSQPARSVPAPSGAPTFSVAAVPGSSLTGTIPVTVSWSADTAVRVIVGVCGGNCTSTSELSEVTLQSGMAGSISLNQPVGGRVFLGANASGARAGSVSFRLTTALTTYGSLLIIGGAILLLIGLVLRRRSRPVEPAAGPTGPAPAAPGEPVGSAEVESTPNLPDGDNA